MNFPVPVSLNLFAAAFLVFIFGIAVLVLLCLDCSCSQEAFTDVPPWARTVVPLGFRLLFNKNSFRQACGCGLASAAFFFFVFGARTIW